MRLSRIAKYVRADIGPFLADLNREAVVRSGLTWTAWCEREQKAVAKVTLARGTFPSFHRLIAVLLSEPFDESAIRRFYRRSRRTFDGLRKKGK